MRELNSDHNQLPHEKAADIDIIDIVNPLTDEIHLDVYRLSYSLSCGIGLVSVVNEVCGFTIKEVESGP